MFWTLVNSKGNIFHKGKLHTKRVEPATVDSLVRIMIELGEVRSPDKLTLKAELDDIKNEWDIWVYPEQKEVSDDGFVFTDSWNEQTKRLLDEGENILLVPKVCKGRKARFASHFWNPIMFNWNPMIVGTWIDASHPVFNDFPTDNYADWQWWDILNHATAMELNELFQLTPLIQSIDSYETNHKLGIAYEAKVGKGRLFVLCVDWEKGKHTLAISQLMASVKKYVASEAFTPVVQLQYHEVDELFSMRSDLKNSDASNAILQLLNK